MYTSYYGMSSNPFLKDESIKYQYESKDYKETISRFNYLNEIKGIGLFVGETGYGKTYTVRSFINSLNKDLHKVIYLSFNKNVSLFDFYKSIMNELGLDTGACYGIDMYNDIQKEIKRIVQKDRMKVVIIIDDAHHLTREILQNFKVLYDFEMDSKDYVSLILIGNTILKSELSKIIYEELKQRIVVNYTFNGLDREEVKEYVKTRLEYVSNNSDIFTGDALNALYNCCKSSPRKLNSLVLNSLMLGYQNKEPIINSEIIMNAKKEMEIS